MRLMDAVMAVNRERALVVKQRLLRRYESLRGRCIGVLGLTYKPGTNTLRRSIAEEIISGLVDEGAKSELTTLWLIWEMGTLHQISLVLPIPTR